MVSFRGSRGSRVPVPLASALPHEESPAMLVDSTSEDGVKTRKIAWLAPLVLTIGMAGSARALIMPGAVAPAFTKSVLGGGTASLSDYSGKVVVLFLLGYD